MGDRKDVRPEMSVRREIPMSGQDRAKAGCVLTFENALGRRLVLHRSGAPGKTVGPMCDEALAYDPTFRLICYSSPATVYTDIIGGRASYQNADGYEEQMVALAEKSILRRVGRYEMLHPRLALLGQDERENRVHAERRKARRAGKR